MQELSHKASQTLQFTNRCHIPLWFPEPPWSRLPPRTANDTIASRGEEVEVVPRVLAPQRGNQLSWCGSAIWTDRKPGLPSWCGLPPRTMHGAVAISHEQIQVVPVVLAPEGSHGSTGVRLHLGVNREPGLPSWCGLPPCTMHNAVAISHEQI